MSFCHGGFLSYPIYLDIRSMPCLVLGGGRVGLRKTRRLLSAGARVKLIDPAPLREFYDLKNPDLFMETREFLVSDLDGVRLAFAATNDAERNKKFAEKARIRGIWCNIADAPELSDFFLPSLVQRGDLSIAISTEGKSPALARKLRMDLERLFDAAYIPFVSLMGEIRKEILLSGHDPETHKEIFRTFAEGPLLDLIRENRLDEVAERIGPFVGGGEVAEKMIRNCLEGSGDDLGLDKGGADP